MMVMYFPNSRIGFPQLFESDLRNRIIFTTANCASSSRLLGEICTGAIAFLMSAVTRSSRKRDSIKSAKRRF